MSDLAYTFLTDGSSDACLMPVLNWLLIENGVKRSINGEWADFRSLPRLPKNLAQRIETAIRLYECDLLFIHRDAEGETHDRRRNEIAEAVDVLARAARLPAWISVIPVRMQEAWLLLDEDAIRSASGNPRGRVPLHLPRPAECEHLPDPKRVLHDLLQDASDLNARRKSKLRVGELAHRVPKFIKDFDTLRALRAFCRLEAEVNHVIQENGWNLA